MEYDAQGNVVRYFALDAEGKPTLFKTGRFARADFTFDQWGNIATVTTFDTTGRPVRQADVGCEVMKNSFDDQGNLLEARCYNSAGQPVDRVSTDGLVYHLRRLTYGERNLPVSESYFNKDEKPVNGGRGWHRATFGYDSNGFRNEWRYFDAAGKPVAPNGYHIQREIKNKVGLASEVRWFGIDLQPVAYRGSHQMHLYYDAHGNRRAEAYFGVDGKPATDAESGCHRFTSQYDRFRNVTQTEKFDIAGNRTRGTGTFHRKTARFNEFGENVSEQYFDESLQPALGPDGVHQIKRTMDDRGREIAIEYFGTNGKPAENAEGIHRSLFEYNQKNQQTKRQHFGKDDAPASDLAGVHLAINEYDGVGRSVRETRLGKHLEGVWMPSLHIATQRIRYDSQGNINDLAWFDSQDRLMPGPLGFARMTVEQQSDGTKIYTNCGTDNKPTISRLLGWARTRHKYRDGRLVSQSFHAPDDSLIEGPEGWAVRSDEYDSEGRLFRREHRDRYLKPVYTVEGYFRGELRPGAKAADLSDYTFFDIQNRPMRLDENIGLPYVSEISSADAVAVSIGLAQGDIVWRLGTWFVPEAVLRARQQGMAGKMAEFLISEFLAQLKQIKLPATLSVLRDGRLVNVSVPRIPLGVKINGRHLRPEDYDRLVQSAGVRAYAQR
jgi:hypothetical protein